MKNPPGSMSRFTDKTSLDIHCGGGIPRGDTLKQFCFVMAEL